MLLILPSPFLEILTKHRSTLSGKPCSKVCLEQARDQSPKLGRLTKGVSGHRNSKYTTHIGWIDKAKRKWYRETGNRADIDSTQMSQPHELLRNNKEKVHNSETLTKQVKQPKFMSSAGICQQKTKVQVKSPSVISVASTTPKIDKSVHKSHYVWFNSYQEALIEQFRLC